MRHTRLYCIHVYTRMCENRYVYVRICIREYVYWADANYAYILVRLHLSCTVYRYVRRKGCGFSAVLIMSRVSSLAMLVINRVCFGSLVLNSIRAQVFIKLNFLNINLQVLTLSNSFFCFYSFLDNGVMRSPKRRRNIVSLVFTCLCRFL